MSGTIVNNVARASGTIAATPGGLDWSTAVVTGSTVTVEAGKGYFINTTSNACTVTLPASANSGDQIVLADYARTWATNAVTLDSNGLTLQGEADTYIVTYDTAGQSVNLVYSDSTKGWLPVSDDAVAFDHGDPPTQRAIFGYGYNAVSITNLVNSSGVIGSDVTGVGTGRHNCESCEFGGDKAIFAFGRTGNASTATAISNLVSNSGVVAANTAGVGTARYDVAACKFGGDRGIFGFGYNASGGDLNITSLVSNVGVISSDVSGVSGVDASVGLDGAGFGGDKGIMMYGTDSEGAFVNKSYLISNTGVIASGITGVGTKRTQLSGAGYGGDKAVFAYGFNNSALVNTKNLVSNTGVVSADVTGVGTARYHAAAASYGGDKAIFGFGGVSASNLCSNTGVIAADVTQAGTDRQQLSAAGYSISA